MKADNFDRQHRGEYVLRTNDKHLKLAVAAVLWRRDQDESNVAHRHEGEPEVGNVMPFKRRRVG